jgi:hypothetical protein
MLRGEYGALNAGNVLLLTLAYSAGLLVPPANPSITFQLVWLKRVQEFGVDFEPYLIFDRNRFHQRDVGVDEFWSNEIWMRQSSLRC